MPLAVYILGLSIFAQGTSELMLAGLIPVMSADLGVSVPEAGLLISAFAMGMLVGAPVLAIVTSRWPRRTVLLAFTAIFVLTHVVAALTSSYGVLFATRVAGAFVYAGFWAVAASTAIGLVPVNARAKAMSVLAAWADGGDRARPVRRDDDRPAPRLAGGLLDGRRDVGTGRNRRLRHHPWRPPAAGHDPGPGLEHGFRHGFRPH